MDPLYTAHRHNHKCVDLVYNKSDIIHPDGMRGKTRKKKDGIIPQAGVKDAVCQCIL